MLRQIYRDIHEAYGSFESPRWDFVIQRLADSYYADVIEELGEIGVVNETTDPNDDCSRVLSISRNGLRLTLRLSLIGRYACVHDEHGVFFAKSDLQKHSIGSKILKIIEAEGFLLIDPLSLQATIAFENKQQVLYAVLFSSDGLIE